MTKQVDARNQIWYEQQDNLVKIGFTKAFLQDMDQCWHILPANLTKFRSKAPLLTVETNDALISIMSPVSGNFMQYSHKAQNFPDKLTEDDVVVEIGLGPAIRQPDQPVQAGMFGDRRDLLTQRIQVLAQGTAAGRAPVQVNPDEAWMQEPPQPVVRTNRGRF